MPRKPKFDHPMRRLRETISKTQEEFAQMLGVGKDLVQSIELWRADMSEDVALKVRQQTGCVPFRTQKGKPRPNQKVLAFGTEEDSAEHEYTKTDYDEHQQSMRKFAELEFGERALAAARTVNLLFYAAAERGGGYVLSICDDLERFVMATCEQYKLDPYFATVARNAILQYIGRDKNPEGSIKSFAKAPLAVASSFLLPTERQEASNKNTVRVES